MKGPATAASGTVEERRFQRREKTPPGRNRASAPRLPWLTIRVDHDVAQWLKKHGKRCQTRINAILRSHMEAQSKDAR